MMSRIRVSLAFVLLSLALAPRAEASHALPLLNLSQKDINQNALCAGCTAPSNSVILAGDSDSATCDNVATYTMDIEVRLIGTPFANTANYVSPGMSKVNCQQQAYPTTTVANLAPGAYHWQARERLSSGSLGSWVMYNGGATAFNIVNPANISANPGSLQFGNQPINTVSNPQLVTITSTGAAQLNVSSITISGPFTFQSARQAPFALAPNVTNAINVSYAPVAAGMNQMGALTIISDALGSPTVIPLTGNGTQAQMGLMPASFDFGPVPVGTTSAQQPFTINNTGSAPLVITAQSVSGPFAVANFPMLPVTIAPGGSTSFQASFSPQQVGTLSGGVKLTSNDLNSPITLTLVGTGTSLGLNATPNPAAFGSVLIGAQGSSKQILLASNINQPITVQSITVAPNSPEFTIDNLPMLPLTIAPMGSVPLSITFAPQAHGMRAATLTVTSDAPNSPVVVAMAGLGIGPVIGAAPSPLVFGDVNVGGSSLSLLTVQNTGEAPLKLMSATFGGANGVEFTSPVVFPINIASGASAALAIKFAPLAGGMRDGKVTIVSSDALNRSLDVPLAGNAVTPTLSVMPMSADFGSVNLGNSTQPLPIVIGNTGKGALTVSGITLGGMDAAAFTVSVPALPMVIPPGASRTVSPIFTPVNVGKSTARLTVVSDDPNAMNFDVALTGTGLAPMISVEPGMIDFGAQVVNHASAVHSVTVTNGGTAPLTLSSASISGPQGSAFSQMNPPMLPVKLMPGGKQTFALLHTPAMVGMDAAKLSINSDDPMSPTTIVNLAGAGVSTVIAVSPMSIDFGAVRAPGTSAAMPIKVSNIGTDAITLLDAVVGGTTPALFKVDSAAGMLAAGDSRMVNVTFAPTVPGDAAGTLTFNTTDASIPAATVQLTGKGAPAKLTASPGTLDFGSIAVGLTSATRAVTLTNTSAAPVTIMSVTSDNAVFPVATTDTMLTLAAGAKTTFTVAFAPAATGPATAHINVTLMDGATAEVMVSATGTGAMATLDDGGTGGATPASGCNCEVGAHHGGEGAALVAALMLLGLMVRRRRGR